MSKDLFTYVAEPTPSHFQLLLRPIFLYLKTFNIEYGDIIVNHIVVNIQFWSARLSSAVFSIRAIVSKTYIISVVYFPC